MRIALCISANRGLECLKSTVDNINVEDEIVVFTFKEEVHEPPFTEEIANYCRSRNIELYVTNKLHDPSISTVWENMDLAVCIGWRYLIPQSVYDKVKKGMFVFHDSYLPNYRGFSPTVWSIRNGEKYTGASLFKISPEMDEGELFDRIKIEVGDEEYIDTVTKKITESYKVMLQELISDLRSGKVELKEQDHANATYTCSIKPDDFKIDWSLKASDIFNMIRAYSYPYPGAFFVYGEDKYSIQLATIDKARRYVGIIPGRVIKIDEKEGVWVCTGDFPLVIKTIRDSKNKDVPVHSVIKSIKATLK